MPTATFYPSVLSQPASPEGAFSPNPADAPDWINIGQAVTDANLTTNVGSLNPSLNSLPPLTPPTPTDTQLASKFAYNPIALATVFVTTKMARGVSLLRLGDNAAIDTVITAAATSINSVSVSFRFADTSYGIDSVGGSGAAVYTFAAQQRNNSGVIGVAAQNSSLFDYAGVNLYCYYVANTVPFGTLPTVAQVRAAGYGINFRMLTSDAIETTPYIGINGLSITIDWTEPATTTAKPRRQLIRLPDGRIAAARARIR